MILIERYSHGEKQTIGNLFVLDSEGDKTFDCFTLELPWLDNKNDVSCIPVGIYKGKKRRSKKYKNHIHILDVKGREYILIHNLNYFTETRGCIGVGDDLSYINNDDIIDVKNSVNTLKELLTHLPDEFEIKIENRL